MHTTTSRTYMIVDTAPKPKERAGWCGNDDARKTLEHLWGVMKGWVGATAFFKKKFNLPA